MTTSKPTIELKGIKFMSALSEETPAYTAQLYVDGVKWGQVSNSGHGGCDNIHLDKGYTHGMVASLEGRIKETYPSTTFKDIVIEETLECICHGIVWAQADLKRYKTHLARKVMFNDGGHVYEIKAPAAQRPSAIAHVKKTHPNAIIWNELSDAELIEQLKATS